MALTIQEVVLPAAALPVGITSLDGSAGRLNVEGKGLGLTTRRGDLGRDDLHALAGAVGDKNRRLVVPQPQVGRPADPLCRAVTTMILPFTPRIRQVLRSDTC
ncbi:hypothetical protein KHC23_23055 [Ancylobacter dichloromethanicus]|uniref:Uncharacterized protein n=1 Tax=Ancylobacter dichloromethanicus TaxID=518825 RepID=A0A9W6N0W5_9HYPH|nr:hypothetical protein [Ancylobacter dichloromethanicus]MBS7556514.1 hypothetical protein [Ancylobacter dichloromethanicus]GLK73601.1 hypothetical protein GCM10017643_37190 [Ancylobacter dichloromethanicus]